MSRQALFLCIGVSVMLTASLADAKPRRTKRHHRNRKVPLVVAPVIEVDAHLPVPVQVDTHTTISEPVVHSVSTQPVVYRQAPPQTARSPIPSMPSSPDRIWHLGGGLGSGFFMDSTGEAASVGGAVDLRAGLRIGPMALQVAYWSPLTGPTQHITMAAVQIWRDRFWLKGGLGVALLLQNDQAIEGGAAMVAVGVDLMETRHVVVDVHLQGVGSAYEMGTYSTASMGLGVTWY